MVVNLMLHYYDYNYNNLNNPDDLLELEETTSVGSDVAHFLILVDVFKWS